MASKPKPNLPEIEDDAVEQPKGGRKRVSSPGVRHRIDNGPREYELEEVSPPDLKELGTLTRYTTEIIQGGPRAVIAAEHKAAKMAAKFGTEIEAVWCLTTKWIEEHAHTPTGRHALHWRPRYLAVLSLTRSMNIAARAARVPYNLGKRHREYDPEFDQQCMMAEERAVELLHDVTFKSAIEGELEPVYWQGVRCGYIRKVDNRLRIEMLRAYKPKTFTTPGSKIAINTGNVINGDVAIFDTEETDRLIQLRREALDKMQERKLAALPAEVTPA